MGGPLGSFGSEEQAETGEDDMLALAILRRANGSFLALEGGLLVGGRLLQGARRIPIHADRASGVGAGAKAVVEDLVGRPRRTRLSGG